MSKFGFALICYNICTFVALAVGQNLISQSGHTPENSWEKLVRGLQRKSVRKKKKKRENERSCSESKSLLSGWRVGEFSENLSWNLFSTVADE